MSEKVYPRVKVRVTEQEDYVYPENDSGTWSFLKLIQSLNFEEEENQSKSQASISKNTNNIVTRRFTPLTKGILKNTSKQVGEVPKENARASSVIRPRAVLSSPDNDGLIGSINDMNNNISLAKRKKDPRGIVGGQAKVLANHGRRGGEVFKDKAPPKAKCTFETLDLKRGHALKKGASKSVGI